MQEKIDAIRSEALAFDLSNAEQLEQYRLRFLSKKGLINELFEDFRAVSGEEKKRYGKSINALKQEVESRWQEKQSDLADSPVQKQDDFDPSRPPMPNQPGSRHPLSLVRQQIIRFFENQGFNISEGHEVVDDWHNFGALNFDDDHPARDMQDTFFVQTNPDILLRTHTSTVQVKEMQLGNLPIRTISPGRVYRNETVSARSHMQFHQVEGLYIAENVSFAELKQTLYMFANDFFGQALKVRFRASYFPFTEPSAEMDVSCFICNQEGCSVCKQTGWVEILGCGMVDPQVLENCGIDSKKYSGYAFGMGIERMTMLKYQLKDIRLFFENDIRFLQQFGSVL
ncbi:MAG: phenylalanine--tRNA ligase subunit alpha [Bacteroidia bacterium]